MRGDIRPNALMQSMEEDEQALSQLSKAARRVKIDTGHTWNLRLLPVEMGPEKKPYVRLAQHWRNKRPLTCPQHTSVAWGGNPDIQCPVCVLADELNESGSQDIRDLGYDARCVLRFRFWCVVFDKEDNRGRVEDMADDEIINPYEFDMYKTTWEDYRKFQNWANSRRRGTEEPSPWGILDLDTGCNVLASHGAKGVRLDRLDPGPIFDLKDPDFDAKINKIWSRIRKPTISMPSERDLLNLAAKIQEDADSGGGSRSRGRSRSRDEEGGRGRSRFRQDEEGEDRGSSRFGSRSRRSGEDEEEGESERPVRRRSTAEDEEESPTRPSRSFSREPVEAPDRSESRPRQTQLGIAEPPPRRSAALSEPAEPDDDDQVPGAEVPSRPVPPPRRSAPPTREPAAEADGQESAPPPRRGPEASPPPPPRRAAAPPAEEQEAEDEPAPSQGIAPPPTRRTASASVGSVEDPGDTVPEEARDPAPPVKEPVEDAPTPVASTPPTAARDPRKLQERLTRIANKHQ